MAKQKIKMEVGKRYKGYGVLNEYGEWTFEPCRVSDNPRNMKIVSAHGNCTVYESVNYFKVAVKLEKNQKFNHMLRQFSNDMMKAIYTLREYLPNITNSL